MSRKRMMMLNTIIVFFSTIINILLGLIEIKLFLSHYGTSINGLMQTGNQILNYMALLESGLCSAYMFYMYKAVAKKNTTELSCLYKGFKESIQRMVRYMYVVAIIMCLIYPLLIKEKYFSYFTVFSIFILLAIKMIIPYRISIVPKQMIILNERKYIVEFVSGFTVAITYVIEIAMILWMALPVQILISMCIIILILSGVVFRVLMERIYNNVLQNDVTPNTQPNKMSKDVMVHTLSGLVFGSTDSIVLSLFSTLNNVTIYSNYTLLSSHAVSLSNKLVDGATASLGIKIAQKDNNSYNVFRELFSLVLFISVFVTSSYILMINDFISLWVGSEYCVNILNTWIFGGILLCGLVLPCLQSLVSASGKFKESKWYIVSQAALNLFLTIALVPFFGITGALIGTISARVFITVPFNYRTIYKDIFPEKKACWIELITAPVIVILICLISSILEKEILYTFAIKSTILYFVIKTLFVTIIGIIISFSFYYYFGYGFKDFLIRLVKRIS